MRIWRVRRMHDCLDADVREVDASFELVFAKNDHPFLAWRFPSEEDARAEADTRLRDLLRVGWRTHW